MAIGTAAAIGLGLSAVGGVASAVSSGNAANRASDVAQDTSAANNALARDIYGQNQATLSPFVNRGNAAGEQMNALLGLGGSANSNTQPNALATQRGGTSPADYYGIGDGSIFGFGDGTYNPALTNDTSPQVGGGYRPNALGAVGSGIDGGGQYTPAVQSSVTNPTGGQTPQGAAENAFDIYRNSTGYQFRLGEGMDAVNSGWAGAGTLQSGAAMRAAQEYGQNFASNEFGNYMGYLGNQQGVGLGAASAQAGVGQNYVNTISNNNNSAGSAAANAALVNGQNNPFGSALGALGGGILGLQG